MSFFGEVEGLWYGGKAQFSRLQKASRCVNNSNFQDF